MSEFTTLRAFTAEQWRGRCLHEDDLHYREMQPGMRWTPYSWRQIQQLLELKRFSNRRRRIKAAFNEMGEAFRWAES